MNSSLLDGPFRGLQCGDMKVFFARHGESEANLLRVMSNRDMAHRLTANGREQALLLAKCLAGKGIGHVYASPICRARETAEIVADELDVPLTLADGLREFDCGVLEGRGAPEAWEKHHWVQNQWYFHNDPDARIEGGENFLEIETRFRETFDKALEGHDETDSAILFVTHGAALTAMMPLLLDNVTLENLWEHGLKYITVIEAAKDGNKWVCARWNGEWF